MSKDRDQTLYARLITRSDITFHIHSMLSPDKHFSYHIQFPVSSKFKCGITLVVFSSSSKRLKVDGIQINFGKHEW